MFTFRHRMISAVIVTLTCTTGCVYVSAQSPIVTSRLQLISAGHTGCTPADNAISNVDAKPDGSGTWNATCQGRQYLCSAVASIDKSESFSCAPVAGR